MRVNSKNRYETWEHQQAKADFERFFETPFPPFYDGRISFVFRRIVMDIPKFDGWLHKQHGNYEESAGLSMQEIIQLWYGEEALRVVKALL